MMRKFLGLRPRNVPVSTNILIRYSREELDMMYDNDTVDIKQFGRMKPGRAKDEMRASLEAQRQWYNKAGLLDWAEQIDIALWIDDKENQ